MGLTSTLSIGYAWQELSVRYPVTRWSVDGFALQEQRMVVKSFYGHHWLHEFICSINVDARTSDGDVLLRVEHLRAIAAALEAWADDPEVLAPSPGARYGRGGATMLDADNYETNRDEFRAEAKEDAARVRKAADWMAKRSSGARRMWEPAPFAVYRASWF